MKRQRRGQLTRTPQCPDGHGEVIPSTTTPGHWICIHHAHDGRPASHPLGAAGPTRKSFTDEEVWSAV